MDMSTEFSNEMLMDYFVSMLLVGIGVALIATGLFTSYFGAGKSQKVGFGLLFLGIALIAYFVVGYPLEEEAQERKKSHEDPPGHPLRGRRQVGRA